MVQSCGSGKVTCNHVNRRIKQVVTKRVVQQQQPRMFWGSGSEWLQSILLFLWFLFCCGRKVLKGFHTPNSDTLQIFSQTLPKPTHSHTDLKVGLSIEAGCGDVTGAICTIWRQQHQVNWERFIFSHTNNVPHVHRQKHTHTHTHKG